MEEQAPSTRLARLARDYRYILLGLPLAAVSFGLLVPLAALSIGTFVIWLGALLMPLTLLLATSMADLARSRLRSWGRPVPPPHYRPIEKTVTGLMRVMTDPRRWFDLVFATIIALPLRLVTFVLAVTWSALALGGLTSWFWQLVIPGSSAGTGWPLLLELIAPELAPQSARGMYVLDSAINLVVGALALITLPRVVHGLAQVDGLVTGSLLGRGPAPAAPGWTTRIPTPALRMTAIGWTWLSAGFAAVILLAVGWPVLASVYEINPAIAMVLAITQSAALVLAVRWPGGGGAVILLSTLGTILAAANLAGSDPDPHGPWPWPVTTLVAYCLVIVVIALRHHWLWAAAVWSTGTMITVGAYLVIAGRIPDGGLANGIVLASISAGLGLLAIFGRLWMQNLGRAERAERVSAEELQRRRDLEERNRIARELHDVVAHSMSVINVQSTTARYRKPGIPPEIQHEFDDIAESSRQALNEMRSLLSLLRTGEVPTAPVPTVADIPDLIEATRASGAQITYSGPDTTVSPAVGLTAFRVVQEGLSNALRHSPGSTVEVTVVAEADAVTVRVLNSAPVSDADHAPGSGLGLAGVRERIATVGGTVEAGPRPGGGYRLYARIPIDGGEQTAPPLPE
ncbi:sensor histidine kinase [Ruania suaedae]|uniref:sensor histidine kinase n=1 Tax=Ruania suaedae TaxID=2897774 RepID=UPI001E4E3FFD|nr:sensor histidine kinase [Ruania suaedae]UFU03723.1 sensor histidine kinase [Ruania suaedae]